MALLRNLAEFVNVYFPITTSWQQVLGGGEGNIALMRDLAEENDKLATENARLTSKCAFEPAATSNNSCCCQRMNGMTLVHL